MILFFYGPNRYAARQELTRLVEAYIKKTGSDLGLERLDGSQVSPADLMSIVGTVPFLATSRLVIVEGFGQTKPASGVLDRLVAGVPRTSVVILYDPEADSRSSYFKTLAGAVKPVRFELLEREELIVWLAKEARRLGGQLDRLTAQVLVEAAGEDQWRLHNELVKLITYQSTVTRQSIDELVVPNVNQSIFDLTEAMTAGRGRAALTGYQRLLGERVNEHYILTMVTWQLRNLLLAKTAGGITPAELAKTAGLSQYVAGKSIAAARGYDEAVLRSALVAAADCEYRIKSGAEPAQRAVERLILAVAAGR